MSPIETAVLDVSPMPSQYLASIVNAGITSDQHWFTCGLKTTETCTQTYSTAMRNTWSQYSNHEKTQTVIHVQLIEL